jgi:hypothetical protein
MLRQQGKKPNAPEPKTLAFKKSRHQKAAKKGLL